MPVICSDDKSIQYIPPDRAELREKSNAIISVFIKYAQAIGLEVDDVSIQHELTPKIVIRVDKRKGYFLIFHDKTKINEVKQAALVAYWILKLKPFMVQTRDPIIAHKYCRINEGFALFYLLSALKQCSKELGYASSKLSNQLCTELMYAFTYWDLSKEAIIMMAETLGEAFFGINAQGIESDGDDE